MRSANGRTAVIFEAENAQANQIPRNPELVFDKIGDQYFSHRFGRLTATLGISCQRQKRRRGLEGSGNADRAPFNLRKVV